MRNTTSAQNLITFIENYNEDLENLDFIEESNVFENSSIECKSKSPTSRVSSENINVK